MENSKNELQKGKKAIKFDYGGKQKTSPSTSGKENYGRIGTELARSVSYDRQPALFDSKEMQARDAKIVEALEKLRENDLTYHIDRRDKPVYLTHYQQRIVMALSYYISQPEELAKDDVRAKIADPYKAGKHVSRIIPLDFFTSLIFGKNEKRYKETIRREIYKLAHVRQFLDIGNWHISVPLINLGVDMEADDTDDARESVEIIFGSKFFARLENDFSPIYKKLFIEWRKNRRQTELYGVLLNELLFVYPHYIRALKKTRWRIKDDKKNKRLRAEELDELVKQEIERTRLLDFELTIDKLKNKIGRDYESNRANRLAFWKDLANAVEGLRATGLIESATPPASTHPRKIVFTFSTSYNDRPEETTPLLEEKEPTER